MTTTGGEGGAGIGGGLQGEGSEITISGGSVKVVEGIDANLIGGGYPNKSVTPTDGLGKPVYLMELNNSAGADVTINGKAYPKQHSLEKQNIYVYLPAKTGANPNVVKVGSDTTKYCYDLTNLKWIEVIDIPEADDEVYVYNGSEQTYTLTQSEYYTISDNTTQTDVGTYRITVSLNDKINTVWSDGTTDDKEYKFIIKAVPEIGTVSSNMLENNLDINQIVLSRTDETIAGFLSLKEGTILQYGTSEYTYVFHSQDENYADIEGTVSITITDTIAPTATYQVGTNGFKAFMNATTFGYFFKNTQTVEIEYTDDRTDNDGTIPVKGSGVQTKQYYIASEPVAEDAIADIEWEEYTQPISLDKSGKYFVYAKVTDYAGNTAIMNSEGIVIYEESVLKAASVEYIYKSNKNISFELDAKGNTFEALKDCAGNDVNVANYIVTDNSKITFKAEYLDTLNVAEQPYTYKIYMNPQGVEGSNLELCYEISIVCQADEPVPAEPVVGTEITSQDGSATYKVTEAGKNSNEVTYQKPTDKNAKTVVIPSTVTINNITYKVTAISATAFANNKKITSVTIGNNVTSIPSNAFKNFKNLVTVKMGSGVKTIGKNAFYGCSKLKNLTLGKNVVTIGDKAFYKCTSLTKLTIPSKVKKIGKSAFEGCKALKTITVGKSVTEIGAKAFYGCSKLKTLTIKSTKLTTKKIGSKAFGKTPKSVTVKVPKKKFNAYKSMLIKSGVDKKAKFKKS